MTRSDHTAEAEALFRRFAERHGLAYTVETEVPIEVCWTFPEQPKLSLPLTFYGASGCLFPFRWTPFRIVRNEAQRAA
jgi:hypothetical protein